MAFALPLVFYAFLVARGVRHTMFYGIPAFFGALALMVILYAAFYRRGKGKAVCLALAAVFCVAADQAVKFLVVNTMSPGESEPLLPPPPLDL